MNADPLFDKKVCDHVEKTSARVCCICIRDGKVYLSGEEKTVELVQSSSELTVQELFSKLETLNHQDASSNYVIKKTVEGT